MHATHLKHTLAPLSVAWALLAGPVANAACTPEPYLGSLCLTAASFCPRGYTEANGQLLAINQYTALYSLLGCAYGGDCTSTFALPDLRSRVPVHIGTGPGLHTITQGEHGGAEQTVMTVRDMPAHTHMASTEVVVQGRSGDEADQSDPSGHILADPSVGFSSDRDIYSTLTPNAQLSSAAATASTEVGTVGGGQAIQLRNPYVGLRYCIAQQGDYPPRN
jgi:microcystin-dependent protein